MGWRGETSIFDRLASLAAIAIVAAASVGTANAGETAESQPIAPAPGQSADAAPQGDMPAATSSDKPLRASGQVRTGGSLQHRVSVLAKALQLDARQRTELIAILERQRQAVNKIWSDPSLLPAERTPATRALQERTANDIRAILSEEQKKLYNPPRPQGVEPPSPDVEGWMQKQAKVRQEQNLGSQQR